MTSDAIDDLKHEDLCGCASYGDAVELMLKQYQEVRTLHCNTAYMAVVAAHLIHLRMMLEGNPQAEPAYNHVIERLLAEPVMAAIIERAQAIDEFVNLGGKTQ